MCMVIRTFRGGACSRLPPKILLRGINYHSNRSYPFSHKQMSLEWLFFSVVFIMSQVIVPTTTPPVTVISSALHATVTVTMSPTSTGLATLCTGLFSTLLSLAGSRHNHTMLLVLGTRTNCCSTHVFVIKIYALHNNNITVPPHTTLTLHSNAICAMGREPWLNKCQYKQHSHILLSLINITQQAYIRTWWQLDGSQWDILANFQGAQLCNNLRTPWYTVWHYYMSN